MGVADSAELWGFFVFEAAGERITILAVAKYPLSPIFKLCPALRLKLLGYQVFGVGAAKRQLPVCTAGGLQSGSPLETARADWAGFTGIGSHSNYLSCFSLDIALSGLSRIECLSEFEYNSQRGTTPRFATFS